MKKILLLTFCVIMSLFALVSCDEDVLSEAKNQFDIIFGNYKPVVMEDATLDLYIITDDATQENAVTTVNDKINQYLGDRVNKKFNSEINIHYYTEDQYRNAVDQINSGIVLIAGKAMLDDYIANERLVDLSKYLTDAQMIKKYGFATLNASINKLLLQVSYEDDGKLYYIPNNHIIGSYDYILINKSVARDKLNFNLTKLSQMNTIESTADLKAAVDSFSEQLGVTSADVVKVEYGKSYADKAFYEKQGWICNVLSNPVVDKNEAALAGFGILSGTPNVDAAMEFIYALNTESSLRNLLQYGVEYTNYYLVDGVVNHDGIMADSVYKMNINYTGDVFLAYPCLTEGWTKLSKVDMENGLLQNKEAFIPAPAPEVDPDGAGSGDSGTGDGSADSGSGE